MNKYVSPTIEYVEIDTADVVMASKFQVKSLEGVDTGDEKTAVFDAAKWF